MNAESLKIGQIITSNQKRDAIHVAIAPVVADADFDPGQHVGFNGRAVPLTSPMEPVGIVDPFLMHKVKKGQRFWLFLYPGSITSLRHDWIHPKMNAVDIIRDFAGEFGMTPERMIESAKDWVESDQYAHLSFDTPDCAYDKFQMEQFWADYESITGETVPEEKKTPFFSCAC